MTQANSAPVVDDAKRLPNSSLTSPPSSPTIVVDVVEGRFACLQRWYCSRCVTASPISLVRLVRTMKLARLFGKSLLALLLVGIWVGCEAEPTVITEDEDAFAAYDAAMEGAEAEAAEETEALAP